jgi:hypothetical protein
MQEGGLVQAAFFSWLPALVVELHAIENCLKRWLEAGELLPRRNCDEVNKSLGAHDGDQPIGFLATDRRIVLQISGQALFTVQRYSRLDPCEVFRDRQITAHQLLQRW